MHDINTVMQACSNGGRNQKWKWPEPCVMAHMMAHGLKSNKIQRFKDSKNLEFGLISIHVQYLSNNCGGKEV